MTRNLVFASLFVLLTATATPAGMLTISLSKTTVLPGEQFDISFRITTANGDIPSGFAATDLQEVVSDVVTRDAATNVAYDTSLEQFVTGSPLFGGTLSGYDDNLYLGEHEASPSSLQVYSDQFYYTIRTSISTPGTYRVIPVGGLYFSNPSQGTGRTLVFLDPGQSYEVTVQTAGTAVPEPTALSLAIIGLVGSIGCASIRRRSSATET
jgi:hypothetical protein